MEKKGTYIYWFTYTDPLGKEQVTEPQRFKGTSSDLDTTPLGTAFKAAKLYVMNKKTTNMAIADYAAPKDPKLAKPIELARDDFQYVRNVKLRAVSEDKAPLESAVVDITDGNGTPMRAVVTPADAGVATFENVGSGEITVKVKADGATKTIDSDIELPLERDTAGFEADIEVAGDVNTLDVPVAAKEQKGAKKSAKSEPRGSGVGAVLQMLAGLIFLAIVGAVIYAVMKSKGVSTEQALKKMGVQLPQDSQMAGAPGVEPAAPAADPSVCQFCGQRKDAAGNCACSVTPGASPFAPPSVAGIPRLIGIQGVYSGHIFEISSASAVMGREAGNDIALSNDTTTSRRHATISKNNGEVSIRDEGSSNGTFVNGARITEQRLMPGDEVQVGGSKFRFEA